MNEKLILIYSKTIEGNRTAISFSYPPKRVAKELFFNNIIVCYIKLFTKLEVTFGKMKCFQMAKLFLRERHQIRKIKIKYNITVNKIVEL